MQDDLFIYLPVFSPIYQFSPSNIRTYLFHDLLTTGSLHSYFLEYKKPSWRRLRGRQFQSRRRVQWQLVHEPWTRTPDISLTNVPPCLALRLTVPPDLCNTRTCDPTSPSMISTHPFARTSRRTTFQFNHLHVTLQPTTIYFHISLGFLQPPRAHLPFIWANRRQPLISKTPNGCFQ